MSRTSQPIQSLPDIVKKIKQQRLRRGAKVEENEEEPVVIPVVENDSDSDSDFQPEPQEEDDSESESDEPVDPATPTTGQSLPDLTSNSKSTNSSTLPATQVHPSWADESSLPPSSSEELPVLDFNTLSIDTVNNLPTDSVPATATPSDSRDVVDSNKSGNRLSKAAQLAIKRLAKSEELKLKDPIAWQAGEKLKREKEVEKKKLKKEKLREKKKENRATKLESQSPATVIEAVKPPPPGPTSRIISAALAPPRAPKLPAPSKPSRTAINLGLASNATTSAPVAVSTTLESNSATPPTEPAADRRNSIPTNGNNQGGSHYTQAREAYTTRLAEDPSFTPRIGKFWGHDERLMEPELRGLAPYWRGRGRGGEVRGSGRGGRGGRGGMWNGGWQNGGEQQANTRVEPEIKIKGTATNEDGSWGRGEVNRVNKNLDNPTPASFVETNSWNHDGFEELKAPRPNLNSAPRAPRPPKVADVGEPGTVNPKYAHLPFHPHHRFPFPPAPRSVPSALPTPPPVVETTTSRPSATESQLFEAPSSTAKIDVKLPGVEGSLPTPIATPIVDDLSLPLQVGAALSAAEQDERLTQARGIISGPTTTQGVVEPSRNDSPYQGSSVNSSLNGFQHQVPPHLLLQQQQQQQRQQQQQAQGYAGGSYGYYPQQQQQQSSYPPSTRNESPIYYPQHFSPDSFPPQMHSPTPPPGNYSTPPPARTSAVEIKVPGPSQSPISGKAFFAQGGGSADYNRATRPSTTGPSYNSSSYEPRMQQEQQFPNESSNRDYNQNQYSMMNGGEYLDSNGMMYYPQQQQQQQQYSQQSYGNNNHGGGDQGYYNSSQVQFSPQQLAHLRQQQFNQQHQQQQYNGNMRYDDRN